MIRFASALEGEDDQSEKNRTNYLVEAPDRGIEASKTKNSKYYQKIGKFDQFFSSKNQVSLIENQRFFFEIE